MSGSKPTMGPGFFIFLEKEDAKDVVVQYFNVKEDVLESVLCNNVAGMV